MGERPDFEAIEAGIYAEALVAIETLQQTAGDAPLAFFVLCADPYNGWYEFVADTTARNQEGAQEWNARIPARVTELRGQPDAWQRARTYAPFITPLTFDPDVGNFFFEPGEEELHTFEIDVRAFVESAAYAELNEGGEDGWLEGHMRFVIAHVMNRLVADGAFRSLALGPVFRLGYVYPDSSRIMVTSLIQ